MDFTNKITKILETLSVNQSALASKMGVSRGIVSEFASGAREPSKEFLFGLSKIGISLDWFLTGQGDMFLKQTLGIAPKGAVLGYSPPGQLGMGAGANSQPIANLDNANTPALVHFKIPLLKQKVSCGQGVDWEAEDNIEEYLEVQAFIPRLGIGRVFAVKAQGSSMLGAGIHGGDYVFFDGSAEQTPQDGIYVFTLDGDVYCKRLEFDKLSRKIKIFSVRVADLEKAELVVSLDTEDAEFVDRFRIFGRVTRCIRLIDVDRE